MPSQTPPDTSTLPIRDSKFAQSLQGKPPSAPSSSLDTDLLLRSPVDNVLKRITRMLLSVVQAVQDLTRLRNTAPLTDNGMLATLTKLWRSRRSSSRAKGHGEEPTPTKKKAGLLSWLQQIIADLNVIPEQVETWLKQAENRFDQQVVEIFKNHPRGMVDAFSQLWQTESAQFQNPEAQEMHQNLCRHWQQAQTQAEMSAMWMQPDTMQQFSAALRQEYDRLLEQGELVDEQMTDEQVCHACVDHTLRANLSPALRQQYANLQPEARQQLTRQYGASFNPTFFPAIRQALTQYAPAAQVRHDMRACDLRIPAAGNDLSDVANNRDAVKSIVDLHHHLNLLKMQMQPSKSKRNDNALDGDSTSYKTPTPFSTSLRPPGVSK